MPVKKKGKERFHFPVVVERQAAGFFAFCPTLTPCYGHGISYELALDSVRDSIRDHLTDSLAAGQPMPTVPPLSLTIVEVDL